MKTTLGAAGLGGTAFLALLVSGQYAVEQQRVALEAALRSAHVSAGSTLMDPWRGRVSLAQVVAVRPQYRMSIGSIEAEAPGAARLSLIGRAEAGVSTITAHDLRFETHEAVISIPRLETRGATSGGLDLARVFDPDSPKPLMERLTKLSAGSISAPEVIVTPKSGEAGSKDEAVTFRGVMLTDIVEGRIGSAALDGADTTYTTKEGSPETASLGRVSASKIDLPLAMAIARGSRTDPDAPLRPVYESFSIATIKVRQNATDGFEVGPIQSDGLQGRPLLVPIKEAAALLDKSGPELSDTDRVQQTKLLADIFRSFSMGRFEIRDFSFSKTEGDDPASLKLGRFLIDGFERLKSRSIAMEHFELAGKQARVSISRAALDGMDGSGAVDVFGAAASPSDATPSAEQIRRMAPKLADASLLDLKVEVPNTDGTGNADAGRTIVFTMPVAELRVGGFVDNLASDVSSHLEAVYDVTSPAPDSGLDAMAKAGFGHLDMTSDYVANWNGSTHDFKLDQLSFAAKDLAAIHLGGTLSNMLPDLMNADKEAARRAAQQLQFRSLSLGLVNSGLAEKALPLAAASMNVSVPELKASLTSQANDTIAQILGGGSSADQLSAAVARFIEQPKTLDISVKAPEGMTLESVVNDPQEAVKKLEISAVANR